MNAHCKHIGEYVPSYMKSMTRLHLLMVVVCIAGLAALETIKIAPDDTTTSTYILPAIALVIGGLTYIPSPELLLGSADTGDPKRDRWNTRWGWVMMVLTLCMIGAGFVIGYGELDSMGWLAHKHDTPVWIQGDWMVGEYRVCQMETAKLTPAKVPSLFCGKTDDGYVDWMVAGIEHTGLGDFHVLPVTNWGRIDREYSGAISWHCQRNSDSLTCKAMN